jgi:hypothetical protein
MGRQPSIAIGRVLTGPRPKLDRELQGDDKRSIGSYKRTIVTRTASSQDANRNEEEDRSSS